jgi:hypothetical protein
MPSDTTSASRDALWTGLSQALTFHASFDNGPDADFALGDPRLYSASQPASHGSGTPSLGLGDPPLSIVQDRGKYGAALEFAQANSHVVLYKAAQNVAYSTAAFSGTVSFWMSLEPSEIPGTYCDPLQITDKKYSDACIWVDFTKNDTPSDFRLGVFGDASVWDPDNKEGGGERFFWRLVKVAEPPFAKGRWTHVAVTWDGLNSSQDGRARLYFDAEYQGASGRIAEPFTWDVSNAYIRLGTGHYVGLFDDIAIFNRALSLEEIRAVYGLNSGIAELRQR